jgi:cation:H+ antiporter
MLMDWIVFVVAGSIVVGAGIGLASFADALAEHTGMGALWFGAVVVATVTSLPELVTDVAAVRRGALDLALGDIFGSSMANMAILASVTVAFAGRRLLQRAAIEHVLTASLAIVLTCLALLFINTPADWSFVGIGVGPVIIAVVYVTGTYFIRDRQSSARVQERDVPVTLPLGLAGTGFVLSAAAIVIAAPFLAESAEELAKQTGLGETFFGSSALAFVTSLPELSVSIAAIRFGALNLAIGNLLGSNATNMLLLLFLEIASPSPNILSSAGPGLEVSAIVSIALMAIGVASIVLKADRGRMPVDIAALVMLALYITGMYAVYDLRPR